MLLAMCWLLRGLPLVIGLTFAVVLCVGQYSFVLTGHLPEPVLDRVPPFGIRAGTRFVFHVRSRVPTPADGLACTVNINGDLRSGHPGPAASQLDGSHIAVDVPGFSGHLPPTTVSSLVTARSPRIVELLQCSSNPMRLARPPDAEILQTPEVFGRTRRLLHGCWIVTRAVARSAAGAGLQQEPAQAVRVGTGLQFSVSHGVADHVIRNGTSPTGARLGVAFGWDLYALFPRAEPA